MRWTSRSPALRRCVDMVGTMRLRGVLTRLAALLRPRDPAAMVAAGFFAAMVQALAMVGLFTLASVNAFAVPAGTAISNTASIQYTIGGIPSTTPSNTVVVTTVGGGGTGPTPGVLLSKTTLRTFVSVGDFLEYTVRLDNTGSGLTLPSAIITDTLPPGMRYKKGSTRVNGVKAADPAVSGNGNTLVFSLGNVAVGSTVEVRYVVEVVGTTQRELTNTAVATAPGGILSNEARATVKVREDVFSQKAFLEGRVIVNSCDPNSAEGLKGVRIYLENGTYVVTDDNGSWHIEGVKPGTHVVQLDTFTLPKEYELRQCEDDSRHAGRNFSQFVDVQGGSLWRADFYVAKTGEDTFFNPAKKVLFDFNKDTLHNKDENLLKQVADKVQQDKDNITIDGHTDNVGSSDYNQELSERRALTVKEKLEGYGVDEDQISLGAHGFNKPEADNAQETGRASNRRVEISKDTEPFDALKKAQEKAGLARENKGWESLDTSWLSHQDNSFTWEFPGTDANPVTPSTHVAIKHRPEYKVKLYVNGEEVDPLTFDGTIKNNAETVGLSRWRGVHLQPGNNTLEAVLLHSSGKEMGRLQRIVHYSGEPVKAELVSARSQLVADGKQRPVIAVKLTDRDGYPARTGMVGYFNVNAPYESSESINNREKNALMRQDTESRFFIGRDGVAMLELAPTTQSGEATVSIRMADNKSSDVHAWLAPGTRDWIFVALAESEVGQHMVSGNAQGLSAAGLQDGIYDDNRAAFFAKGQIKGEWLLTTAFDSDKSKDEKFRQVIDPNTYYTLYGDNTKQGYDAASTKKLYLKLEKKDFYTLYGDYDTGMNDTELGKYTRSATGIKSELNDEHWKAKLFATESGQAFMRDEIRGDGTSGLYQLGSKQIVINTDRITIETRDRFHNNNVISVEMMTRFIDYNIDYETGTVYFRKPIPSSDNLQNPVFIVAEYEADSGSSNNMTAGGRVAYEFSHNNLVGITSIHEGNVGAVANLTGFDTTTTLTPKDTLKTEYATSDKWVGNTTKEGEAYLVKLAHDGEKLDSSIYVRQQAKDFGLGQQAKTETGMQETGADLQYTVDKNRSVIGDVSRQKDTINNASRDVASAKYRYENNGNMAYLGTRYANDTYQTGQQYTSDQLLLGGSTNMMDKKLTLHADSEVLTDKEGTATANSRDYPNRVDMGADYHLNSAVDLLAGQQYTWGDKENLQATSVGMQTRPWTGAETTSTVGQQTYDSGDRTYANMGLVQTWNITNAWHVDASVNRSKTISRSNGPYPTAQFNSTQTEDFTAFAAGVGYQTPMREWTTRVETRHAATDDKVNLFMGYLQKLDKGVAMSLGAAITDSSSTSFGDRNSGDIRYGIAYRPSTSAWNYFNRFDYLWDHEANTVTINDRRLVDNFMANYKPDTLNQLSLQYGGKYNLTNVGGNDYSGYTDLLGGEYRRTLARHGNTLWDAGVRASTLNNWDNSTRLYSYGLSVGMSPGKNMWISIGYNLKGFMDTDFSGSDYMAQGFYFKIRVKMDQESLRDLWAKN